MGSSKIISEMTPQISYHSNYGITFVVVLLFYNHNKQLWSCWDGQLT